jgi:hypothetical protein
LPLLAALSACAKNPDATSGGAARSTFTERVEADGLVVQEFDLDKDGRNEVINHWRPREGAPRLLVQKQVDLNRDGKMDVISWFDDAGQIEREEMDSDYDGVFDWVDHYQGGARVMSEWDSDTDGRANVFKYYVISASGQTVLERKERDTDGDGKIDLWERFNLSGEVVRMARDLDGDGKMDQRDE